MPVNPNPKDRTFLLYILLILLVVFVIAVTVHHEPQPQITSAAVVDSDAAATAQINDEMQAWMAVHREADRCHAVASKWRFAVSFGTPNCSATSRQLSPCLRS